MQIISLPYVLNDFTEREHGSVNAEERTVIQSMLYRGESETVIFLLLTELHLFNSSPDDLR